MHVAVGVRVSDFIFAFVDYYFSLKIYSETRARRRKLWLLLSVGTNLGLLLYFKYTYFLITNVSAVGTLLGQDWSSASAKSCCSRNQLLYVSFISYTLDVYRRLFTPIRQFPCLPNLR